MITNKHNKQQHTCKKLILINIILIGNTFKKLNILDI